MGARPRARPTLRADGHRVAARKPAQSYAPDELGAHRRRAPRPRRRRPADDVCPRAPLVRDADGAADGRRRARRSRRSRSPTSRRDRRRRRRGRRRHVRRGRRRTPLAARRRRRQRRPRPRRRRAASRSSWPTPGSARSTRCGSSVDALAGLRHPRGRSTATTPTTTCTGATAAWLADAGYQVLTSVDRRCADAVEERLP